MKTPEELTTKLKEALGEKLKSVILYGSAASGDRSKKYSDFNILAVSDDLDLETLKTSLPVIKKWTKAGNPPPLFFTAKRIMESEDVFPLEFIDIKNNHKVLFGADPFENLKVNTAHLRHQIEYELRGKLIQLRERFLESEGKPKAIQMLLGQSLSTFAALLKGVLILTGEAAPAHRSEVWENVKKHVNIDLDAFRAIEGIRDEKKDALSLDPEPLLARYLKSIESVVDFVDQHRHPGVS